MSSRDDFEAWAAIKFAVEAELLAASRTDEDMDYGFPYRVVNKHGEGSDLVNTLVGTAWAGWEASRAALVIELPPMPDVPEDPEEAIDDSHMDAYHSAIGMRHACLKFIEAAGVKVKS